MSAQIIRKLVVFNVADAHQRELLEWTEAQTGNFSGYVKDVLFAHKCGGGNGISRPEIIPVAAAQIKEDSGILDIL